MTPRPSATHTDREAELREKYRGEWNLIHMQDGGWWAQRVPRPGRPSSVVTDLTAATLDELAAHLADQPAGD